jgi:membrane protein implicated in regulation of membrane protease activity
MAVVWLIAMAVFLIVEGIVPGLVSIWFALGALAALIAAMVGAPLWLQLVWFVLVSIAALALTRPLARKYVNGRVTPTNADRILGRECVVRETIDNLRGTGAVAVDGKVWTARMLKENETAREGETVIARRIDGVKLIVEKV